MRKSPKFIDKKLNITTIKLNNNTSFLIYNSSMNNTEFNDTESFKQWARSNHKIGRFFNTNLISENFHLTKNPYSPHIVTLSDGNMYIISHTDKTVSIIDAKTSRMSQPTTKELISVLKWHNLKFDLSEKLKQKQKEIIFFQQRDHISKNIYPNIIDEYNKGDKKNNLKRLKKIKYITKLYNETIIYNDIFREKTWDNKIDLTNEWKEYFSQTILQNFLEYNERTNFLGRDWIENLFPNNIFIGLRTKLSNWKLLSLDEIAEFINYLIEKENDYEWESQDEMRSRHHRNQLRSHVINMLYALMYTEQRYNFWKVISKTKNIKKIFPSLDTMLSEKLDINQEDIYTEWWVKGLPSMAFKELRWDDIKDYIRWRTWVERNILEDEDKKYSMVQETFSETINNIKKHYEEQWYDIEFLNIDIANKFKWGDISFEQNNIDSIKNRLIKEYNIKNYGDKENDLRSIYKYDIKNLPNQEIDQRTKNYIQYAIDKDNSKTGGNGSYADIKFRLLFRLINKKNPEQIIENMSYEHMIVNMDSENEGWLSDHNIFLDPLKTIQSKLRISTAIDTDIFVDSVSGGIDKTIKELTILKYYLDNTNERPHNMSLKFITNQLKIRNNIPQEILDIAWLQSPLTYLQVDKDKDLKEKIELAVARYLLTDQFSKWRLHRFIYDNDTIPDISDSIQEKLKDWKDISYIYKWQQKLLQEALENRHTGKYCLCWGWSHNMMKAVNSKLHSGKWYIGIVVPWTSDEIMFIWSADFSGIVNLWTTIKNNDLIISKVEESIINILQQHN